MFNIHVKGDSPNTKVFRYKSRITGEVTEFLAERGLVTIEGVYRGEALYKRESRREFLCRAAALSLEIKHMVYGDEKADLQRLVVVMAAAAKHAGEQGDPFNRRHLTDMVNAAPARSQFVTGYDPGIPAMPEAPAGKPHRDLAGTQVVDPRKIIVTGR